MALDRRTLRELLKRPLIDDDIACATVVLMCCGEDARRALHTISVSVRGAQRRASDHVLIELGARVFSLPGLSALRTEIHLVGVGAHEEEHPVTVQIGTRAQGVLAAGAIPRVVRSLPKEKTGDDPVAGYIALVERVLQKIRKRYRGPANERAPDSVEEPPPSVGTRRCELAMLGVSSLTAQELLTALDTVMERSRYQRCAHAGGGRDFVLIRGHAGAALRVMDDRAGSATDLAVQLSTTLDQPVLAAEVTGEQEVDRQTAETLTTIKWALESVSSTGIGFAYSGDTTYRSLSPNAMLDVRVAMHVAGQVFSIQPQRDGFPIHYERV